MADVTQQTRQAYYGLDADKSSVTGVSGDTYFSIDIGIMHFWNDALAAWDNGHKQRIRSFGRGATDLGFIAPLVFTRFGSILYRGSALEGVPTNYVFYLAVTGPGTVTVRLQDITNAQTIGSSAGLSGVRSLRDIGALANVPAAFAELELQVLPSGGGNTVEIDDHDFYTD